MTVKGNIIKISGPVLDVRFAPGEEPPIHALVTTTDGSHHMEVFGHLGDGAVRCVALEASEGVRCGAEAFSDGQGIRVALVVSLTVFFTVCIAKLVGCTLPMLAKRLGFDPAVMASPFITTVVDALSLLVYFAVAARVLGP